MWAGAAPTTASRSIELILLGIVFSHLECAGLVCEMWNYDRWGRIGTLAVFARQLSLSASLFNAVSHKSLVYDFKLGYADAPFDDGTHNRVDRGHMPDSPGDQLRWRRAGGSPARDRAARGRCEVRRVPRPDDGPP